MLFGVMGYELVMQYRRRALPLMTAAALGATLLLLALMLGGDNTDAARQSGSFTMTVVVLVSGLVLTCVLPLVTCDVVPLDRIYEVESVLLSTRLPVWAYLGGKLLSVWLLVGAALLVSALAIAGFLAGTLGSFDLPIYAVMWLTGIFPYALLASGLAVLLGAWVRTRRAALVVGTFCMFYTVGVYLLSMMGGDAGVLALPAVAAGHLLPVSLLTAYRLNVWEA